MMLLVELVTALLQLAVYFSILVILSQCGMLSHPLRLTLPLLIICCRPSSEDYGPTYTKGKSKSKTFVTAVGIWFAQIVYLFEGDEGSCAHMHWLSHGGDTILRETARPRELFVLYCCSDSPLGSIAGKLQVDFVGGSHAKAHNSLGAVELNCHEVNRYFYRLGYSKVDNRFDEVQDLRLSLKADKQFCKCCALLQQEELSNQTSVTGVIQKGGLVDSVLRRGDTYSVHDFVYLAPEEENEPYIIGQIMVIKSTSLYQSLELSPSHTIITFQVFKRYDTLVEPYLREFDSANGHAQRDCRRLYRDNARTLAVSSDRLDGKCVVTHIIEFVTSTSSKTWKTLSMLKIKSPARKRMRVNDASQT